MMRVALRSGQRPEKVMGQKARGEHQQRGIAMRDAPRMEGSSA